MDNKQEPVIIFEDLNAENEEEAPQTKKGGPIKKGFYSNYTHFITIPLIGQDLTTKLMSLNKEIISQVDDEHKPCIHFQAPELLHLSLAMLNLRNDTMKKAAQEAFSKAEENIRSLLKDQSFTIKLGGLQAFLDKKYSKNALPKLLYVEPIKATNADLIDKITNCIIRALIEKEVVDTDDLPALNITYDHTTSIFRPTVYHATLMRIKNTPEKKFDAAILIDKNKDFHFDEYTVKRVDISTRREFGDDKFYKPLVSINL